jgi:glycerol-3-phosphate acyltransferase PlsY
MKIIVVCLEAYLIGSIPFGYLIVRLTAGADVRETGSGGTGATNVSRRAGKLAGVLTLVLDALKGAAAIAIARFVFGNAIFGASASAPDWQWWVAAAGVIAIAGHCFPIWLGFRGGKGVATGVGVFLMLAPLSVVVAAMIFLLVVLLTRYVSLGSIIAAATIPLIIWLRPSFTTADSYKPTLMAAIVGGALIIFMHRANIAGLISGTESKFR